MRGFKGFRGFYNSLPPPLDVYGSIGSINQGIKKCEPIIDCLMRLRTFAIFSVSKKITYSVLY